MRLQLIGWLVFCVLVDAIATHSIMFFSVFGGKSHRYVLDPVAEELGKRGHQVVFISSVPSMKKLVNVTDVYIPESEIVMNDDKLNFFTGDMYDTSIDYAEDLRQIVYKLLKVTFAHPYVQNVISNPRDSKTGAPKFDLVVIDPCFNQFGLVLSHLMSVPTVYISTAILPTNVAWSLNIPYPVSYVPTGYLNLSTEMTFWERVSNAYDYKLLTHDFAGQLYAGLDVLIAADPQIPNDVPSIATLENRVSFVITNDHPALGPRVPTMPYYVQLGGLHLKSSNEKLTQDLEDFMQSSGDVGVVYFSLGSYTKGTRMPSDMERKLIETFSRVPYKVLWKSENSVEGVSDNVKVLSWAPQQTLLAHPKLRLFITHGGLLSVQEATFYGCPMLGLPLRPDQKGNMATVHDQGFGESIEWRSFTSEELHETIVRMVKDERYKVNAKSVSEIFRDRSVRPVDAAAYWIEYVIRHKGAGHLKSGAEKLNIFQYFVLDIVGAIGAIVLIVSASSFWIIVKLFKGIVRRGKQKKH